MDDRWFRLGDHGRYPARSSFMPVLTDRHRDFPSIAAPENFGDHRFSSFEPMGEALATLGVGLALMLAAGGVMYYGSLDRQRDMYMFGGGLFVFVFSILPLIGIVNIFKARKQVHVFEKGIVQTNHKGTVSSKIAYGDITDYKMQHSFQGGQHQIDRYSCLFSSGAERISFSDYARRYQTERSEKLERLAVYLRSRMPKKANSTGNF